MTTNTDLLDKDPISYWEHEAHHWLGTAAREAAAGRAESAQGARLAAGMAALKWLELRVDELGSYLMPEDIREQLDSEQAARAKQKSLAAVQHRVCAQLLALKLVRPEM
jgi:hypothetical protein